MPNDNIVWEPEAYYENGQWRGGWRLSQEAADKRDREYLESVGGEYRENNGSRGLSK